VVLAAAGAARIVGYQNRRGRSLPSPICSRYRWYSCATKSWVIVGFRNLEPKSIDAFEIIDTIPVTLDDEGYLVAL